MNRHEIHRAESAIDSTNELVHRRPQVLVLLHVLPRGDCQLRKNNLTNPFGMLGEEKLKRVKLLRDTFDVVQSVHTNNDLDIAKSLLELRDPLAHALFFQILAHLSEST